MSDCSVVNIFPFETVCDESLRGVLPFALERGGGEGSPAGGC